jgi:hypothetical protein
MSKKTRHYPVDFNLDGTPKAPVLLWIVLCYLSRHLLLVSIAGLNALSGLKRGRDKITASFDIVSQLSSGPWFLIASIPAFAVLIALIVRSHAKSAVIRTILTHGHWLAASSALIDVSMMVFHWKSGQAQINEVFLIIALLDFYAAWYLVRSARVRATFSGQ